MPFLLRGGGPEWAHLYAIEGYGGDPVEGAFRYRIDGPTRRLNADPRDGAVVKALQRRAALRDAPVPGQR